MLTRVFAAALLLSLAVMVTSPPAEPQELGGGRSADVTSPPAEPQESGGGRSADVTSPPAEPQEMGGGRSADVTSPPAEPQELDEGLKAALSEPGRVIVLSIHPDRNPEGEQFMGYPVMGRVEVPREKAREVTGAVLRGLEEAEPQGESCFAPRHGLIIGERKLILCYSCRRVIVEFPKGGRKGYATTSTGNEQLARVIFESGLTWQGWQPVGDVMRHPSGLAVAVPAGYAAQSAAGTETLTILSPSDAGRQVRIKVRPVRGEAELRRQYHRLRRAGYLLEDAEMGETLIKTAERTEDGVTTTAVAALVDTPSGKVMVTAEIPMGHVNPLPDLLQTLREGGD